MQAAKDCSARKRADAFVELSGRSAGRKRMRNQVERRVNRGSQDQPRDRHGRKHGAGVREAGRNRVRNMADAALMLVERPGMEMRDRLEGERHHHGGQNDG